MHQLIKTAITTTALAISCLISFSGTVQAEERRSASANLHIQVVVVPTLIAAQAAERQSARTANEPISYSLSSDKRNSATYSVREMPVNADLRGRQPSAVLQTLIVVPD